MERLRKEQEDRQQLEDQIDVKKFIDENPFEHLLADGAIPSDIYSPRIKCWECDRRKPVAQMHTCQVASVPGSSL